MADASGKGGSEAVSIEGAFEWLARHPGAVAANISQLYQQQHFDRADQVAAVAVRLYPNDRWVWMQYAMVPMFRPDKVLAAARFKEVRLRFPDQSEAYIYEAMALRQANRVVDAEPLLEQAMAAFPTAWQLFVEYVHCAHDRRRSAEAVRRSAMLPERFPDRAESFANWVDALLRDAQLDLAETAIKEAVLRFPNDPGVLRFWALTASRRNDWREAVHRWDVARSRCPEHNLIAFGFGEFRLMLQLEGIGPDGLPLTAEAGARQSAMVPAVASASAEMVDQREDLGKFLLRFEGLGDNCEFGFVQRIGGVEPLGLLRWASMDPDALSQLLESRFAGIGEAENTRLEGNDKFEYFLFDKRYFRMHTFISVALATPEELMPKMLRRLRFLKDKMIDDLTEGEKTFVYKRYGEQVSKTQMDRMLAAIRNYGPGRLLVIHAPPTPAQDMTVERVEDGLVVGYLSKLQRRPEGAHSYFKDWVALCRAADKLR